MYNTNELNNMGTIENNLVYGELKIDTDKTRVYIDNNSRTITVEESIDGFEDECWDVEQYQF
jgi:hypothetical protein